MATPQTNEGATRPAAPAPAARSGASWASKLIGVQGPLIGLVALCVLFSFASHAFLSFRNLLNVLDQVTVLGILSLGMTAVIILGGIDLSVGSVLAFSMMILGWLSHDCNLPLVLAIVVALLIGALCGWVNGLLVTRARLPAFIATLSMMTIARGLANIITDGRQIVGYPDWFDSFATLRYFGFLSLTVAMALVLVIAGWIFLRYRAAGRGLYAIGGSAEVARLAGLRVRQMTSWVYVASGLLSGLAGIVLASRLDSSQPSAGLGYELDAIAAVVIGRADALALGAAHAVKVANVGSKVWIFGFDGDVAGLKAVRDGTLDATMTQKTQYMGKLALDSALDLIDGKQLPKEQLQEAVLTTKENVGPFIDSHP